MHRSKPPGSPCKATASHESRNESLSGRNDRVVGRLRILYALLLPHILHLDNSTVAALCQYIFPILTTLQATAIIFTNLIGQFVTHPVGKQNYGICGRLALIFYDWVHDVPNFSFPEI